MNYHYVIHQQALVRKVVEFSHVITLTVKMQAMVLQNHLFKVLLDELDAPYGDLLLQADVWWLSCGKKQTNKKQQSTRNRQVIRGYWTWSF